MVILIVVSAIALTFGLLFLFAPRALIRLSEWGNKPLFTDHGTIVHRKGVGIFLVVVALFLLATALRIAR